MDGWPINSKRQVSFKRIGVILKRLKDKKQFTWISGRIKGDMPREVGDSCRF